MDRRIDIMAILKQEGKTVKALLYPSVETETDPFEHTKANLFLNPLPVDVHKTQLSFESLKWKYTGQVPVGSIKIICAVKYEGVFKLADKIKIEDNYYKTMKDDSQGWMIIKRDDHLVIVLSLKNI